MRILVLGAGGTGGYFGARLAAAGADLSFLVRARRAAQLRDKGLVVRSPLGDLTLPVRALTREEIDGSYDLILLGCKAYDLEAAMEDIAPAVGERSLILPLLNGLAHMPRLDARFGAQRVLGGLCHIAASLGAQGEVLHLNELHSMTAGARFPAQAPALGEWAGLFGGAGFVFRVSETIEREMWEKYVFLTSLAAMTCLMRASVGDIAATRDGGRLMSEMFAACVAVATAAGHPPGADWQARTLAFLTLRDSPMTASMLRDLEAGGRTEVDHVLGDMLERAEAAGVQAPLLSAAYCHMQAGEARRRRTAA